MSFTSWREFLRKTKNNQSPKFDKFSRANARYQLAIGAKALDIEGLSASTTDAYSAALRITLAYSALEALEVAIGAKNQIIVTNAEIANVFRDEKESKLRGGILEIAKTSQHTNLYSNVQAFFAGNCDDLRPIIYTIRNLMCHGTFTANRLYLPQSKKRRALFHDLANETLQAVDLRFTLFVSRIREYK